ncbi:hypothetical protein ACFHYQ_17030 [Sphaerimonospora cavernae]|uniref:Uncharacterized protein n=1 Tax=Sphaerimonospora cavernae TaxID=1740611 RepID=A0ABV6U6C8_9ACTN
MAFSDEQAIALIRALEELRGTPGHEDMVLDVMVYVLGRLHEVSMTTLRAGPPDPGKRARHELRSLVEEFLGDRGPMRDSHTPSQGDEQRAEDDEDRSNPRPRPSGPTPSGEDTSLLRSRESKPPISLEAAGEVTALYRKVRRACGLPDDSDPDFDRDDLTAEGLAGRWQRLNVMLLRLPRDPVSEFMREVDAIARTYAGTGFSAENTLLLPLVPGDKPMVIVRGWPELDVPTVTTHHEGRRRAGLPGPGDDDLLGRMSDLATLVLAVADLDPSLFWYRMNRDRPYPLAEKRAEYDKALTTAIRRVMNVNPPGGDKAWERLSGLYEIDAHLASVAHYPPAFPGSWWDHLRDVAYSIVNDATAELESRNVVVRRCTGTLSRDDEADRVPIDVPMGGAYPISGVLACLRLEIVENDRVRKPARVLYREGQR